jgi:hypothetical protein
MIIDSTGGFLSVEPISPVLVVVLSCLQESLCSLLTNHVQDIA